MRPKFLTFPKIYFDTFSRKKISPPLSGEGVLCCVVWVSLPPCPILQYLFLGLEYIFNFYIMPNLAIFSYCYPDCAFDLLFYLSLVCIALAYLWYVLVLYASLLLCLLMLLFCSFRMWPRCCSFLIYYPWPCFRYILQFNLCMA